MKLYNLLKTIDRSEFIRRGEYRKNVALIATTMTGRKIEVNIERLREFFERTKDFLIFISEFIVEGK